MRKLCLLAAVAGLLLASTAAYAGWTTIYEANFDSAPYSTDTTVNGTDGWAISGANESQAVIKDDGTGNHYLSLNQKASNVTYRALPQVYTGGRIRLTHTWAMTSTKDPVTGLDYSATNMGSDAQNMWTMLTNGTSDVSAPRTGMLQSTYNVTAQTGALRAWNGSWVQIGSFALYEIHTVMMDLNLDTKTYDVYVDNLTTPVMTNLGFYNSFTGPATVSHLLYRKRYNTGDFGIDNIKLEVAAVPEPSSLLILGCGLTGIAGFIRRRK